MINLDQSDKENLLNECKAIYYLTICLSQKHNYENLQVVMVLQNVRRI